MYQSTNRRQRRDLTNSRKGAEYQAIDQQISALHLAMGKKLLANPTLLSNIKGKVEERYQSGFLRHGAYITWLSILEQFIEPDIFIATLTEDSYEMKKLRRKTPLVGILTERERQEVLDSMTTG